MIIETAEISKREHDFIKDDLGRLVSYGSYIARSKGYDPAGYGITSPRIYQRDNKYYFEWERMKSCD